MRILGIDCGIHRTGFGVIESDGRSHRLVASGVIQTRPGDPTPLRLREIAARLRDVVALHGPQAAAVEQVFGAVNIDSALKLAQARGVALLAVAEAGLEFGEYSPLEIKMSIAGYGHADKRQVQFMVSRLLGLAEAPPADASDALAAAICHATRREVHAR